MWNACFPARLLWFPDAQRVVAEQGSVKAILPMPALLLQSNTACLTVSSPVCYAEPVWGSLPMRATIDNA